MIYDGKTQLRELLIRAGLRDEAHVLLKAARNAAEITWARMDDSLIPVGGSKFGGAPDLPPETLWPECLAAFEFPELPTILTIQCPLRFICQFDCDELLHIGCDARRGHMLSFFAATHRASFPFTGGCGDDWKVMMFPKSGLIRTTPKVLPADVVSAVGDEYEELIRSGTASGQPAKLQFQKCLTLPIDTIENTIERCEDWATSHSIERTNLKVTNRNKNLPSVAFGNAMNVETVSASDVVSRAVKYASESWGKEECLDERPDAWMNLASLRTEAALDCVWRDFGRGIFLIRKEDWDSDRVERAVLVTHTS